MKINMPVQTFEDYLMDRFMAMYPEVLDDDLNDAFDHWLSNRDVDAMISWGELYGAERHLAGMKQVQDLMFTK